jgi:hypothetical protein
MKTRFGSEEPEPIIATFGRAKLVQARSGVFELRGGTAGDLIEAREWASLFMPEITIASNSFHCLR